MIKYTKTYWNVVKEILKKLDMVMFGVKYLEKWTSVFCETEVYFFLSRVDFIFRVNSILMIYKAKKSHFLNFEAIYLEGWLSKSYEISKVCKKGFRNYYGAKIKPISLMTLLVPGLTFS